MDAVLAGTLWQRCEYWQKLIIFHYTMIFIAALFSVNLLTANGIIN